MSHSLLGVGAVTNCALYTARMHVSATAHSDNTPSNAALNDICQQPRSKCRHMYSMCEQEKTYKKN
jgi:hypothetical protein